MTIETVGLLTLAFSVALAGVRLGEAALKRRPNGSIAPAAADGCAECRATVKHMAEDRREERRILSEIRDIVRDAVRGTGAMP